MPNWISNVITIKGKNEEIEQVMNLLKNKDCVIDFQNVNQDWVRLNPEETRIVKYEPDCVEFEVDTAWESPDEALLWISREYPSLIIEMDSDDFNNYWHTIFHNGTVCEE